MFKAVSACTNGWQAGQIVPSDDPFFAVQDVETCLKRNLIVPVVGVESVQAKADVEKAALESELAALRAELAAVKAKVIPEKPADPKPEETKPETKGKK